jgi:hypothetical protein
VVPDVGAIGQVHTIGSIGKEKETEKVDVQNLDPFAQEAFQLLHELKHLESSSSSSQNQKIEDDKEKEEEEEKEEQGNETPNSVSEEEEDGNETPDSVSEEDDDNNEEEEEEEKNDMFLRLARVSGRKYATKFSGYPDLRPEQIQQLSLCAAMSSTCAHLWHDNGQLLEDHHKDIWRQDDNKEEPQEGTFPNFHGNENGMQPDFASWRSGDLDFFLVCETQEEAEQQLLLFEEVIRSQVVQTPQIKPIFARSKFAVSALLPTPYRTCQIVLRIYSSLEHVLVGFDWDVCQVGFYIDNNLNNSGSRCGPQGFGLANKNVWATPLGYRALHSGQMILDLSRQSETFESRGAKYVWRGYEVAIPTISIPQIQTLISWCKTHKTALLRGTIPVSGLLRLIMLIVLPKQDSETRSSDCDYGPLPGYDRLCRTLKKYEKNGMRFQSVVGYTLTSLMDTHEFVWNGKRFTTDVPAKLEIPFANSVGSFCPRFDSHWFDCFID